MVTRDRSPTLPPTPTATDAAGRVVPDPDRCQLAKRLPPREVAGPRRAHRARRGRRLFRRATGARTGNAIIVLAGDNTYNAYNTWDGKSLYTGGHRGCRSGGPSPEHDRSATKPGTTTARPGRPTPARSRIDGLVYQAYRHESRLSRLDGILGLVRLRCRFVEWAERAGLSLDLAISSDLAERPELLDGYDLMLSVGHDEYWCAPASAPRWSGSWAGRKRRGDVRQHHVLAGPAGARPRTDRRCRRSADDASAEDPTDTWPPR
ncbi:MAG: DUF6605 domain-containing protein [Ilumatobacteraceae bacterium]